MSLLDVLPSRPPKQPTPEVTPSQAEDAVINIGLNQTELIAILIAAGVVLVIILALIFKKKR